MYLFIVNINHNTIISYSFHTAARVCDEILLITLLFPKFTLEKMFLLSQQVSHCSTCPFLHQERIHTAPRKSFTIHINQFASHIHSRISSQNFLPNPGQVRGGRQIRSRKNPPWICEYAKLWGLGTSMVTLCINRTKQLEVAAFLARPMNKVSL